LKDRFARDDTIGIHYRCKLRSPKIVHIVSASSNLFPKQPVLQSVQRASWCKTSVKKSKQFLAENLNPGKMPPRSLPRGFYEACTAVLSARLRTGLFIESLGCMFCPNIGR
ncbi:unnamed protein product, partial [Ixodes persulcatus]